MYPRQCTCARCSPVGAAAAAALRRHRHHPPRPSLAAPSLQVGRQPLSALFLYSSKALSVYRLLLWASLTAAAGVSAQMLVRFRSSHYALQPWRFWLDGLALLLYAAVCALTFADREIFFSLSSLATAATFPYMLPPSHASQPAYEALVATLRARKGLALLRQILAVAACAASFVPTSDEFFEAPSGHARAPPSAYSRPSRAAIQPAEAGGQYGGGSGAHVLTDGAVVGTGGVRCARVCV